MTTNIRIPRPHKKRLKALDDLSEVNRWGSDVDARIDEILHSLEDTQRAIKDITRSTGAATLGLHAASHRPGIGSDPLTTAAPTSILGGTSSNSIGVGSAFARNDHSHDVATAAPTLVFGTSAAEGSSNSLLRIDATLPIFDVTAPADLANAAAVGVAAFAARRDHAHRSYAVRKNSGGSDFVRKRLNLIEGTDITLTVADDAGSDEVDVTIATTTVVAFGTYTPTRSAEANLDANVTMTEAQYLRVGNTVTVSGRFTADPTLTATATSFEITLPVASNLGAAEDVAGVAFCGNIAAQGGEIIGVVANDTAKVQWIAGDVTSQTWGFIFAYQVL